MGNEPKETTTTHRASLSWVVEVVVVVIVDDVVVVELKIVCNLYALAYSKTYLRRKEEKEEEARTGRASTVYVDHGNELMQ